MAYTINLTNGTVFATIADGTINTSSSMILVGKNYAGYGEFLDENFIHLLENGANSTAPSAPLVGQLWYDTSAGAGAGILKVYTGASFKRIGGAAASGTAPTNNLPGDLWFDTTNQQLKVWSGTAWILVGPSFTSGTGETGAIADTITDTGSVSHVVVKLFVGDQIVGIISKDLAFVPQVAIPGFTTVRPGITLATSILGVPQLFQGTATNSESLNGLLGSDFMRSTAVAGNITSTVNELRINTDLGLAVGADQDLRITVSGNDGIIRNQTLDGNIVLQVNDGGVTTTIATIFGANATASFGNALQVSSLAKSGANAVGNIGSASNYFNRIFATATTALYADVAERFEADVAYEPGTVVELGGSAEITKVKDELSNRVFGVISTRPAFTMNGGAGDDLTHPPVAMTGRVPVKVVGQVSKGDRLVSAGNGIARAATDTEINAFNSIGRALVDKHTDEVGIVEAIVTIK
jgi:hypothetical protein